MYNSFFVFLKYDNVNKRFELSKLDMKKKFIMPFIVCLSLSAYVYGEKADSEQTVNQFQPSVNTVRISLKPEIVGLWGMNIDNQKKCTEYYNFKSNNEFVVKSDKEWTTGFYEYEPMVNFDDKRNILTLHVNYDNNEMDCSGNQVDQSDELSQYSVKWKNPKSIELCNPERPDECFATLNRVLP